MALWINGNIQAPLAKQSLSGAILNLNNSSIFCFEPDFYCLHLKFHFLGKRFEQPIRDEMNVCRYVWLPNEIKLPFEQYSLKSQIFKLFGHQILNILTFPWFEYHCWSVLKVSHYSVFQKEDTVLSTPYSSLDKS